jgi:hypothetical protein
MKSKRSGHWCWCCGRDRPNERFSGSGHRAHICKDCKKLGPAELSYRQAILDVDRLMPKRMAEIKRIADTHPDARVQEYARGLVAYVEQERQLEREAWRRDEEALERKLEELTGTDADHGFGDEFESDDDLGEIPF